ncbi:MAG: hypothetical protein ACRC9K_11370 [Afipia sp.]
MPHQRGQVAAAEAVVAAFMEVAAAFTGAEDSTVGDFTAAVSMAVACEWAADALSAPGPASPAHIQGPPLEAEAGSMHIADMRGAVQA